MKKKYLHFQAKASSTVQGRIEGWASVAEKNGVPEIDRDGEVVAFGALAPGESVTVPILLQHDWNLPVGKGTAYSKVENGIKGIWLEADLAINSESDTLRERAWEAYELVKQGIAPTFSIGFIIKEYGPMGEYQGQRYNVISSIELLEVSVVTVPSNRAAVAVEVRSAADAAADPGEAETDLNKLYEEAVNVLRDSVSMIYAMSIERLNQAFEEVLQIGTARYRYEMLRWMAPAGKDDKYGLGLDMAKICADPVLKGIFREIVDLMPLPESRIGMYRRFDLYTVEEKEAIERLKKSS